MRISIDHEVPAYESYAAERTRGLYNVGVEDGRHFHLDVELPDLDGDWQIGVVVGPSGSGKTSIANALKEYDFHEWWAQWPDEEPIIEVLGKEDYEKACAAMAAVGLGSVPSWLRPAQVLSNGERFRADMAMLLMGGSGRLKLRDDPRVIIDEFTSVLDRRVAQVGAGAFAKSWRKQSGRKVVLVTPHYDILEWIDPDWVIDTHGGERLPGEERKVVSAREGSFQEATDHAGYPGDRVATLEC